MATVPKSYAQAAGEVKVTAAFLNNFAGDNVRRLAKSFGVSGDYTGQYSVGHRWPLGSVAIVTPFNFPLEIPVLQLMGALYMGNKPLLKPSEQVSVRSIYHNVHACLNIRATRVFFLKHLVVCWLGRISVGGI
jgi:1-pyrroline-5-carboxylate dehydrogenase